MKRKSDEIAGGGNGNASSSKKLKDDVDGRFREGLFGPKVANGYTKEYSQSEPYKHAVIHDLMNDSLLRSVRTEIQENVHFTPKETDIYKIHQSGDLANLDGLEDAALSKLPSLLRLRDALYSPMFREYVATITNSGALSGRKTDMAINIYTPGCHLLCHDDVIGSRRVSYILYLTDPDKPWKDEWGGALRLYPTQSFKDKDGETGKTPSPEFSKRIPPAWNQLSFFAVQPGESFHDVEEVYHAATKEQEKEDGGRIRMAISGWFHIPQNGEDGYLEGAEEKLAEKSSLVQLQGKADRFDFPQVECTEVGNADKSSIEAGLDSDDIDFLLKYLAPSYLTPDTIDEIAEQFEQVSSVTLDGLLSTKFSARVREYVEQQEATPTSEKGHKMEKNPWKVARPPHKHRFLYLQKSPATNGFTDQPTSPLSPIQELLDDLLPSRQFQKWLELATVCEIESHSLLARRFRRGHDYALATGHEGNPRLELCIGLTPTPGWDLEDDADDIGGHEIYMAEDTSPTAAENDAAVYKTSSSAPGDEDENILFTQPASWNKMSIVLRDSNVLKFVKYVSRAAKGDRWDVGGVWGVKEEDEDEQGDEEEAVPEPVKEGQEGKEDKNVAEEEDAEEEVKWESTSEEEFHGFPSSNDGDSDSD